MMSSRLKVGRGRGIGTDLLAGGYERMEPTATRRNMEGNCMEHGVGEGQSMPGGVWKAPQSRGDPHNESGQAGSWEAGLEQPL